MSPIDKAEELLVHLKDYLNTRISLIKMKFAAATSRIMANIAALLILGFFIFCGLIFAGIATALTIADYTNSLIIGFASVAGIYFLLGMILWWLRDKIIRKPIMNAILSELGETDDTL